MVTAAKGAADIVHGVHLHIAKGRQLGSQQVQHFLIRKGRAGNCRQLLQQRRCVCTQKAFTNLLNSRSAVLKCLKLVKGGASRAKRHNISGLRCLACRFYRLCQIFHFYNLQLIRIIIRRSQNGLFNLIRRCTVQNQNFHMGQQVRHHHGQIVALIRAALNSNDFLIKGTHAADHTTGRSGDGIVIILYPVRLTDKLNAVLHAAKGAATSRICSRLQPVPTPPRWPCSNWQYCAARADEYRKRA